MRGQDIFYKKERSHLFSPQKQVALREGKTPDSGVENLANTHDDQNGSRQRGQRQWLVEKEHAGKRGADRGNGAEGGKGRHGHVPGGIIHQEICRHGAEHAQNDDGQQEKRVGQGFRKGLGLVTEPDQSDDEKDGGDGEHNEIRAFKGGVGLGG